MKQTLLCDYKMDSLLGGQSSGVLMFTLKKIGDEIIEVNSQDYSFKKEKQVVRYDVDKKDGTKYPAYSKLELDNGKINLLLEVTIDKYTHRTTIDKTGNYYQSAGLAALSGTCREGKPLY